MRSHIMEETGFPFHTKFKRDEDNPNGISTDTQQTAMSSSSAMIMSLVVEPDVDDFVRARQRATCATPPSAAADSRY